LEEARAGGAVPVPDAPLAAVGAGSGFAVTGTS